MSATGSNSLFLAMLWQGSLVLSLLSLGIMLLLVVRRVWLERRQVLGRARKVELTRYLYAALRSPVALNASSVPAISKEDRAVVMRAALDMLRSVKGQDTMRVLEVLNLWDMPAYLRDVATNGRKGMRIQALSLLGYHQDPASLSVLLHHGDDAEMYVQIAALRGLAMHGAVQHIEQITQCLRQSGQTNTLMLSDILMRFGDPAVPSLTGLATSNANIEVRLAALMALGTIGSLQAMDSLIPLLDDPNSNIRAQAIATLGKLGDGRLAASILPHLESDDVGVRVQAAQALGLLQAVSALPKLVAKLSDGEWWVRFRAAEALYRLGDRGIAALRAAGGQEGVQGMIARQVLAEKHMTS